MLFLISLKPTANALDMHTEHSAPLILFAQLLIVRKYYSQQMRVKVGLWELRP